MSYPDSEICQEHVPVCAIYYVGKILAAAENNLVLNNIGGNAAKNEYLTFLRDTL